MIQQDTTEYPLSRPLHWLFAVTMAYAVFSVFALNVDTADYREELLPILAGTSGAVVVLGLTWLLRRWIAVAAAAIVDGLQAIPLRTMLILAIALGVALRVAVVAIFPPIQTSDGATYFALASRLARGEPYASGGTRAFWPPGLPLALTPWIAALGEKWWIPTAHNLVLFVVTVLAAARFAARLGGESAAKISVVVLAAWPNLFIDAGMASKEAQALALMSVFLALYPDSRVDVRWRRSIGAGLVLGAATLTQPSLTLAFLALAAFEVCRCSNAKVVIIRTALVLLTVMATIAPWTVRNYAVLGAFVPITTSSGNVLYIGNNDLAWGGWVDFKRYGELDAALDVGKDEVAANQEGMRRAFAWMKENPGRVLVLMPRKHQLFLGDDSDSVFAALKRGLKIEGALYNAIKIGAIAFWMSISLLMLFCLTRILATRLEPPPALGMLPILLFFYLMGVHSFFESGSRHHIALATGLAALAGTWMSMTFRPPIAARSPSNREQLARP